MIAEEFQSQVRLHHPPPDKAEGDGVIVCGGGHYWSGVVTCVKMLRRVNRSLPVQIWHRAEERVWPSDLSDCGVTYHNATVYPHKRLVTTEIKSLAAVHCGFARFMYIDADAYPVADPSPLFDLARPVAFWENHQVCGLAEARDWDRYGMPTPKVPPVQGGHYFVDRVHAWDFLKLCQWAFDRSDLFSVGDYFDDQHVFRACLAASETPYLDLGQVRWIPPSVVGYYDDKPVIVHLTGCKMLVERIGHLPGGASFMWTLAEFLKRNTV